MKSKIERVYVCCDNIWTTVRKESKCPTCKVKQEPCGWFETRMQEGDVTKVGG